VPSDPFVRKSQSRVLVTGATGFLGRAVADALGRAGHSVRRGARIAPAAAPDDEPWAGYGDVGPATRWESALTGVAVVVYLAGLAHLPDEAPTAAAETFTRVNAEGTACLAAAAAVAGVRRLILMSSALVHGEASPGRPLTEDVEPVPAGPYARSKLDSERRLVAAARDSPLQWVILRPPLVYGSDAKGNFRRLLGLVRTGFPLPLGAATAPRTFIGIDNLADAVVRCVEDPRAANRSFSATPRPPPQLISSAAWRLRWVDACGRRASRRGYCAPRSAWRAASATTTGCSTRSSSTLAASAFSSAGRRRYPWTRGSVARCASDGSWASSLATCPLSNARVAN